MSLEVYLSIQRIEGIPLRTHRIIDPAVVLLESDTTGNRRNEDSSFLGVTAHANVNLSSALLQVCNKVEERNRKRRPAKYHVNR